VVTTALLRTVVNRDRGSDGILGALACPAGRLDHGRDGSLSHTQKDKENLLSRTRRIRGQVEAVERALEDGDECASILQQIAACRGAINGLMGELMEGELRDHVLSPNAKPGSDRARAAERLIQVLRTYLK
jgi:DNA-binding FrmR family transcriptional regulator